MRAQELEIENQKLRDELNELRKLYDTESSDDLINGEIKKQFLANNEELQRYRDECIQYKTIMITQNRMLNKYNNKSYTKDDHSDLIADSANEYEMVYNTQKILNRSVGLDDSPSKMRHFQTEQDFNHFFVCFFKNARKSAARNSNKQ
jgi:hypothetical protein